jgi:nucleoside phosphorylase/predicted nucleotidyltransferase
VKLRYRPFMPPLRRAAGPPGSRTVDLADLLVEVRDLLRLEGIDAYLFGSRRFKTGSIRSDIDILLFLERRITESQAREIWNLEPYLDIFLGSDGNAQSIVNESAIGASHRDALIVMLDAIPLYIAGIWQNSADEWRFQEVLADRNPAATNANLYQLSTALPGDRADLLAVAALPGEYRAATGELGIILRGERGRTAITDTTGSPWLVELVFVGSMGSVKAALETNDSLRRTKVPHTVLLGIAAGVPGQIELGDVILPDQVLYYESSKVIDDGELGAPILKSTNGDVRRAASVFPGIAGSEWYVRVKADPELVLASGEKVVASEEFRKRIGKVHRKLTAIDMESYGVACAAERRGSSLTVIKGISDFADSSKNDDYHEIAAQNSARVLRFLIAEGVFRRRDERD